MKIFLHTFETCPFFASAISISVRGEEEAVIQAITHQRPEPGENILSKKYVRKKILYVQEDELSAHPYLTRDRCLGENSLIYGLYYIVNKKLWCLAFHNHFVVLFDRQTNQYNKSFLLICFVKAFLRIRIYFFICMANILNLFEPSMSNFLL